MTLQQKLADLNLELPTVSQPGGNYVSLNIRGNIGYVAIQFPIKNNQFYYQGTLGENISTEDGYNAMQMAALNVLSQIENKVGIENIEGINSIEGLYKSTTSWDDAPKVVDGASDLFVSVLGEKGKHARSIQGVQNLPRNFAVGLTVSFTMKD